MKHSDSATDFITRRDFMKKSALTAGAITLLSQGIGLASGTGGGSSYYVVGQPAGKNPPTEADNRIFADPLTFDGVVYCAKAATLASPANGIDSSEVSISVELHAWIDGESTVYPRPGWTLKGILTGDTFNSEPLVQLDPNATIRHTYKEWEISVDNLSGRGHIVDHHWIEARVNMIDDLPDSLYRQIQCSVSIGHYRQEYIWDDSDTMVPNSEPVELDASLPIPFTMFVERKP